MYLINILLISCLASCLLCVILYVVRTNSQNLFYMTTLQNGINILANVQQELHELDKIFLYLKQNSSQKIDYRIIKILNQSLRLTNIVNIRPNKNTLLRKSHKYFINTACYNIINIDFSNACELSIVNLKRYLVTNLPDIIKFSITFHEIELTNRNYKDVPTNKIEKISDNIILFIDQSAIINNQNRLIKDIKTKFVYSLCFIFSLMMLFYKFFRNYYQNKVSYSIDDINILQNMRSRVDKILFKADLLNNWKIINSSTYIVDIEQLLSDCIEYFQYNINTKQIKFLTQANVNKLNININQETMYIVVFSLVHNMINLLPQHSELTLEIFLEETTFNLKLKDNSYALSIEQLQLYNCKQETEIMISFKDLFFLSTYNNINISYSSEEHTNLLKLHYVIEHVNKPAKIYNIFDYKDKELTI